jgi:hypothetical protein
LPVHPGGVSVLVTLSNQNETTLGTADFECGLQYFLKRRFGREHLFPLVLEVEDAGYFLEIGGAGREHNPQIH